MEGYPLSGGFIDAYRPGVDEDVEDRLTLPPSKAERGDGAQPPLMETRYLWKPSQRRSRQRA